MIELNSYTLAGHGYFWPVGDTFSSPYAGNPNQADVIIAIDAWPAADDPLMQDRKIGDIENFEWTKNVEKVEPRRAVLGTLVRKQVVSTYQELTLKCTTNSLSRIAFELMFGSNNRLSTSVSQFAPLQSYPKEGVLIVNYYTNENENVKNAAIWVNADVTGGIKGGGNEIVKPEFTFMMLNSDLNTMEFGSESQF